MNGGSPIYLTFFTAIQAEKVSHNGFPQRKFFCYEATKPKWITKLG